MTTYAFNGSVVDLATRTGMANITVEAWDVDRIVPEPIGSAVTDARGRFSLVVEARHVSAIFGARQSRAFFTAREGTTKLASTENLVTWNVRRGGSGIITVDASARVGTTPTVAPRKFTVDGRVADTAGNLIAATIDLFYRKIDGSNPPDGMSWELIEAASTTSGANGAFHIEYELPLQDNVRLEIRPDLKLHATSASPIASMDVFIESAPPRALADIVIDGVAGDRDPGPTEFLRASDADLTGEPTNLTEAQIDFLSRRSNARPDQLRRYQRAHSLAQTFPDTIGAEAFHGLLAKTQAETGRLLLAERLQGLRAAAEAAIEERRISATAFGDLNDFVNDLEALAQVVLRQSDGSNVPVGVLVEGAPELSTGAKDEFIASVVRANGAAKEFWEAIEADTTNFTPDEVSRLKFATVASAATGSFAPLVTVIHGRVGAETLAPTIEALAALENDDWLDLINEISGDFPPFPGGMSGDPDTVKRAAYAAQVARSFERRFRTPVIRARIASSEPTSDLRQFFDDNDSFDFVTNRLSKYLIDHPTALAGIAGDTDVLKARIGKIERLTRLTETWAETQAIDTAGFASARSIVQAGRDAFLVSVEADIDAARAAEIYANSEWTVHASVAMSQKWSSAYESPSTQMPSIPNKWLPAPTFAAKIADWASLFGSADYCQCEHCRSVLGPAAYLVEVLQLLTRHGTTPSGSDAREVLFARRPDLQYLALNCPNADTPLPYVDLVNEILEVKTAGGSWPTSPEPVTTSWEANQLLAMPETIYPTKVVSAYRKLGLTSVFPMNLPFHVWQEEARIYLAHLGVTRQSLIQLFAPNVGLDPRHLTLERLGTTGAQLDIITGPPASPPGPGMHEYWGVSSGEYPASLEAVPVFMKQSSLSYDELRELLATDVCAGAGVALGEDATCDISEQTLTGIDSDALVEITRFLRLRNVLGWSISDTDRVVSAFGDMDAAALTKIAALLEVGRKFPTVKPQELLAWFADMDQLSNEWGTSLFDQVFFDGNAELSLPSATLTLNEVRPRLLSALRMKDEDLDLLIGSGAAKLFLNAPVDGDDFASVANLSRLYRIQSFARANKLSVRDWLLAQSLSGVPGVAGDTDFNGPADALTFLTMLERLRRSPMSLDLIHYVIRGLEPNLRNYFEAIWEDNVARAQAIDGATKLAAESARDIEDPEGLLLATFAPRLLDGPEAANLALLIAGALTDLTTPTAAGFIEDTLAPFLGGADAATEAISELVGPQTEKYRRTYLARRFQRYFACSAAAVAAVAAQFKLTIEQAEAILSSMLTWEGDPLLRAFLPGREWTESELDEETRTNLMYTLDRAAMFVRSHDLNADEILTIDSSTLPQIAFSALPVVFPPNADLEGVAEVFADILRWSDYVWLRARWNADPYNLTSTFAFPLGVSIRTHFDFLKDVSEWNQADAIEIVERFGYDPDAETADLGDERLLCRVQRAVEALRRLGVSAKDVIAGGWLDVEIDMPTATTTEEGPNALTVAASIRRAAAAKHPPEAWGGIARPLRNALREKQRDALVGYLLADLDLGSADDLYENLLIDVQMDPCMLTSRLVMAHGSVQAFIQRIQLGFEQDSDLDPREQTALEWRWMKNYRVWEANRKVFLWPENWIEPDLRGDKTPLFKAFERRLLSGPLDRAGMEDAVRSYLDGLADVSNLEIVAMCTDEPDQQLPFLHFVGSDTVHVIGRLPRTNAYFYRTRRGGAWLPWQKIEASVSSDNVMPFVYAGRLLLAWLEVEDIERPEPDPGPSGNEVDDKFADLDLPASAKQHLQKLQEGQQHTTEQPTPMRSQARVLVSELRGDVWSNPLTSDWAELSASVYRPTLNVVTAVQSGRVQFSLRYLANQVALFSYHPATYQFVVESGAVVATLEDPLGTYGTNILAVPTSNAGYSPTTLPVGMFPFSYQAFSGTVKKLRVPLSKHDALNSAATLLELDTPSFMRVIAARRPEPSAPAYEREQMMLQHGTRSFFMQIIRQPVRGVSIPSAGGSTGNDSSSDHLYRFTSFYHPYVDSFRNALYVGGLDALYRGGDLQGQNDSIASIYDPDSSNVRGPFPAEQVEPDTTAPYGIYNWEVFFHLPFLMAIRLSAEGRYEEARDWFHYIFDPTIAGSGTSATRFWRFKPFKDNADLKDIQAELNSLAASAYAQEMQAVVEGEDGGVAASLSAQISEWRDDPFDPHLLARMRPVAYQKSVVMRYVDNLIAWADSLFAQDTMESVQEAAQLYIAAFNVLGRRPVVGPEPTPTADESYRQLGAGAIDAFGNAFVDIEAIVPRPFFRQTPIQALFNPPPPTIYTGSLYFCVPPNEKLVGYWDIVEDRLFKIRNCQNIEGVTRALPLFQPPIDPGLLVRAKFFNLDLQQAIFDLDVPAAPYRYSVLYGKAVELASAVSSLGQSLLSAIEKKDGEAISNLRSDHEIEIGEIVVGTREAQVNEANQSLQAVQRSRVAVQQRFDYYSTRQQVSPGEQEALDLGLKANVLELSAQGVRLTGAASAAWPEISSGGAGVASPVEIITIGGTNYSNVANLAASALSASATAVSYQATVAATNASYRRRMEDWRLQAKNAKAELASIDKQIVAAEVRLEIARNERDMAKKQLEHSRAMGNALRDKFSNVDLYRWMEDDLRTTIYQAYRVACDAAKRAQKAFQYERGDLAQVFVKPNTYWDSRRTGLLAGERLLRDLRAMDAVYVAQNKRELELTKTIALSQHDPHALVALIDSTPLAPQVAEFALLEKDFDRDFDSHYMRRVKSVSVTVHCAVGPYDGVMGTLTLLRAGLRPTDQSGDDVEQRAFVVESMATSQGQSDAGVFNLDFRDERYLPFEGAGAHLDNTATEPQWRFELSSGVRFPRRRINEVLFELRYTARAGTPRAYDGPLDLHRLVDVEAESSEAWQLFKNGAGTSGDIIIPVPLEGWDRNEIERDKSLTIKKATLHGWWDAASGGTGSVAITLNGQALSSVATSSTRGTWANASLTPIAVDESTAITLNFTTITDPIRENLQQLWLILDYEVGT